MGKETAFKLRENFKKLGNEERVREIEELIKRRGYEEEKPTNNGRRTRTTEDE